MTSISKIGFKINEGIRAEKVRLIDDKNEQVGIVERYIAMSKAREAGLDLVEVAPNSNPPVCRIMDYGKWLYEEKRKFREGRKKTQSHAGTAALKELRMRPETDKHDIEIKTASAKKFLEKGHKVQFTMMFRGRQMLHQDKAQEVFNQIILALEEVSKIDQPPVMSAKRMIAIFAPK